MKGKYGTMVNMPAGGQYLTYGSNSMSPSQRIGIILQTTNGRQLQDGLFTQSSAHPSQHGNQMLADGGLPTADNLNVEHYMNKNESGASNGINHTESGL